MLEERSAEYRAFMRHIQATAAQRHRDSGSLAGIRQVMDGVGRAFPLAHDIRVVPVDCDGVRAEWIDAPVSAADRIVLYAHGGWYISGAGATVREFCSRLARDGRCRVLSVDYRLAPEHPVPAALDVTLACYRWLLAQGIPSARIVVAGESAGGGLTIALLMRCRDRGLPMPAAGVPISPWVDMEVRFGASLVRNLGVDMASVEPLCIGARLYAGDANRRHPLASPLHGDLHGLPPLLIQVGTAEVLLDEGLEIARRLTAAGCAVTLREWPDMIHVWHWFGALFPEAREAIAEIGDYVLAHVPDAVQEGRLT